MSIANAIATGASAATQLAGSFLGYRAQKDSNEHNFGIAQYQNAWNEQMYERQKQDALAMWKIENEYNSPAETMKRMVKAGINPRASSLGNFANAGNVNQPSMPAAAQYNYESPLASFTELSSVTSNILNMLQGVANLEKSKSEIAKNTAQSEMFSSEAMLKAFEHFRETAHHDLWKHQHGYHFDKKGNVRFGSDEQHRKTYAASVDDIISNVLYNTSRAKYQFNLAKQLSEDVGAGIQGTDGLIGNILKPVFRWGSRLIDMYNKE